MSIEKKKVESALQKKGFKKIDSGKDHHWFYLVDANGLITDIRTKTSHGNQKYKTLGDDLVKKMAKQIHMTINNFRNFVKCDYTESKYRADLKQLNKL